MNGVKKKESRASDGTATVTVSTPGCPSLHLFPLSHLMSNSVTSGGPASQSEPH